MCDYLNLPTEFFANIKLSKNSFDNLVSFGPKRKVKYTKTEVTRPGSKPDNCQRLEQKDHKVTIVFELLEGDREDLLYRPMYVDLIPRENTVSRSIHLMDVKVHPLNNEIKLSGKVFTIAGK